MLLHNLMGKQTAENCVFSIQLNAECCFANRDTKRIHMITWSQLIHPHSHKNRSYAPDETVTTHLSFTKSIVVSKLELFFVKPEVKNQQTVLVGYITISVNISCYQTRCSQQYYLPFSNTVYAPAHVARITIQQLLHKTLNFIFLSYGPQQTTAKHLSEKMRISCIRVLTGSAEALLR